jgi:15,16-dihydrobiliverdin:ferredoxin oxidoreductase
MVGVEAFVSPTSPSSNTFVVTSRLYGASTPNSQEEDRRTRRKLAEAKCNLERIMSGDGGISLEKAGAAHGMPWVESIGNSEYENPLLYMPFWEWQMDFMKSSLTNLMADECATADFGYNENVQKKARIVNQCYKSDEYRKIRMTYYDAGDNTQVFNSVWYPDPAYNLPVLGIDLLAFNRKKYLAIVDFQPLHEEETDHACTYEHRLRPIKDQYDNLKGRMSSKFYDETQFFSQQMLFARFEDETVVTKELLPAFKRYVNTHVKLIRETTPDMAGQKQVLERQTAYDTYSAERDPATGLFAAMFGKQWADEFVFDFLFSLSERKEGGLVIPPPMGGPPQGAAPPNSQQLQKQPQAAAPKEQKQSVPSTSS